MALTFSSGFRDTLMRGSTFFWGIPDSPQSIRTTLLLLWSSQRSAFSGRLLNLSVSSGRRSAASDCLSVKYHALVPRTCRPARPCWDGSRVLRGTYTWPQKFSLPAIGDKHFHRNACQIDLVQARRLSSQRERLVKT